MTIPLRTDRHSYPLSEEQNRIVHALTDYEFSWRSRKRLLEVTGLEPPVLDHALARLIHHQLVKPAFGKRAIVFGLRERVEKK